MKKNNHNKDSISYTGNAGDFSARIDKIPNPIPTWMEVFFKTYATFFPADINEGIIEGYPVDDDF